MPTLRNEKEMATKPVDADEPDDSESVDSGDAKSSSNLTVSAKAETPGFFHIYKRGQGKWTRLGTAAVLLLLGVLTAFSLYQNIVPYLPVTDNPQHDRSVRQILLGSCVGFLVLFALLVYQQINKPRNVDFLIATDSEMKKVNWTTQGQLIGSTRVVMLFLFFVAIFLSVVDLAFYGIFHLIGVLQ